MQAQFDIASISDASVGKSRNIFYFSIGEDAGGARNEKISYVPLKGALDKGLGFRLEQLEGEWRLAYLAVFNGEHAGGVTAKLNGRPDAITFTLDGTQATIRFEGTTIQTHGKAGRGEHGGTELTVELENLSAMLSSYTMAFGAYNWGNATDKSQTVVNLDSVLVTPRLDRSVIEAKADIIQKLGVSIL